MPRKAIELPDHIAYLAILDEHGRVDTKLMPELAEEQVRHLHRIMLLSRRFDERLLSLQRQGRIGTFAPVKGQEAAQRSASAIALEDLHSIRTRVKARRQQRARHAN